MLKDLAFSLEQIAALLGGDPAPCVTELQVPVGLGVSDGYRTVLSGSALW